MTPADRARLVRKEIEHNLWPASGAFFNAKAVEGPIAAAINAALNEIEQCDPVSCTAVIRAEQAEARVAALEAALRKYGHHDLYTCAHRGREDWRCTCGLDAALAPRGEGG